MKSKRTITILIAVLIATHLLGYSIGSFSWKQRLKEFIRLRDERTNRGASGEILVEAFVTNDWYGVNIGLPDMHPTLGAIDRAPTFRIATEVSLRTNDHLVVRSKGYLGKEERRWHWVEADGKTMSNAYIVIYHEPNPHPKGNAMYEHYIPLRQYLSSAKEWTNSFR